MQVYSLYILNKAGGLIYQNDVNPQLNRLTANDYLVLAGTLHGVHAITSRFSASMHQSEATNANNTILNTGKSVSPNTNKTGLQSVETDYFNLYVFQTLSGIKFIIVTSPVAASSTSRGELDGQLQQTNMIFKELYVLYSDYVMKDPFYALDMPIKNGLFDLKVKEAVSN